MMAPMECRGPDDRGTWIRGPLALGHTRLSILDLSERGRQPLVTDESGGPGGAITYSGEVYNFADLRRRLEAEGTRFRTQTDAEVVLHALHRWGAEVAVPLLDGMFAFAYFDARDDTLWLARDRAGIKPLYVASREGCFAFASEMKALITHPAIGCRPDLHALATNVAHGRLNGSWTPYLGISALRPGSLMRVSGRRETSSVYFDLLRDLDVERIRHDSSEPPAFFTDRLGTIITKSVTDHLVGDVPVAVMCSGGLDSSLVTVLAARRMPGLAAYVVDVEGVETSEAERARLVCDAAGVELRRVPLTQDEFLRSWPHAVYRNDQPNYFPQNMGVMAAAAAAHRDGCKVLLAGEGADELFSGYSWQLATYRRWRRLRRHARLIPNTPITRRLGSFLRKLAPLDLAALARRPFDPITPGPGAEKRIGMLVALDGGQRALRAGALFRKLDLLPRLEDRALLAHSYEDFYTHLTVILSSQEKMAMTHSVELRFPYLSNAMIDFGLHLPGHARYDGRSSKRVLRRWAAPQLPRETVEADKIAFHFPEALWRGAGDILRGGRAAELLKWGSGEADEIMDLLRGDSHALFVLISLELWARLYLDGEAGDSLGERLVALSADSARNLSPRDPARRSPLPAPPPTLHGSSGAC